MTTETLRRFWIRFADRIQEAQDELNRLDAAIGDADHGTNLARGLARVKAYCLASEDDWSDAIKAIGMALLSTVGGASGALWGSGLLRVATRLPHAADVDKAGLTEAIDVFVTALKERGKADFGDKTMMDVWLPARDALHERLDAGDSGWEALQYVARHARAWAEATIPLTAKKGRAAYLGPRSQGHLDPGALSSAIWWECWLEEGVVL